MHSQQQVQLGEHIEVLLMVAWHERWLADISINKTNNKLTSVNSARSSLIFLKGSFPLLNTSQKSTPKLHTSEDFVNIAGIQIRILMIIIQDNNSKENNGVFSEIKDTHADREEENFSIMMPYLCSLEPSVMDP